MTSEMKARMDEAAKNYIRADKSDPFTAARIATHQRLGISEPTSESGQPSYYSAEVSQETREYIVNNEKKTYSVTSYKNMVRP